MIQRSNDPHTIPTSNTSAREQLCICGCAVLQQCEDSKINSSKVCSFFWSAFLRGCCRERLLISVVPLLYACGEANCNNVEVGEAD